MLRFLFISIFILTASPSLAKDREEKTKNIRPYNHACAPGTEPFGLAPPHGNKIVCRKPIGKGKFRAEGNMKVWHANGERKKEGNFVRGKKHGEWKTYHRSGRLKSTETFYDGKRVSVTKHDRDGNVVKKSKKRNKKRKQKTDWSFLRNK